MPHNPTSQTPSEKRTSPNPETHTPTYVQSHQSYRKAVEAVTHHRNSGEVIKGAFSDFGPDCEKAFGIGFDGGGFEKGVEGRVPLSLDGHPPDPAAGRQQVPALEVVLCPPGRLRSLLRRWYARIKRYPLITLPIGSTISRCPSLPDRDL